MTNAHVFTDLQINIIVITAFVGGMLIGIVCCEPWRNRLR